MAVTAAVVASRPRRLRASAAAFPLGIYLVLLALHAPLLRLPYYWDEAGYYIFAALDLFRHGWLAPHSTLANGHPPLLSLYLSAAWAIGGFHPLVTRAAMVAWTALLIWGVYRLAEPRLERRAWVPALLLALAPLCFAQATLAQLDLPVAALVVWALIFHARGRVGSAAAVLAAAGLMKETAAIVPLALLAGALWKRRWKRVWPLLIPVAAVALWFAYYHHLTGYWLGNPQYFAYNVGQAALSPPRIGLSLLRRLWQLAGYNGTWLLTALALGGAWRRRHTNAPMAIPATWVLVIAAYLLFHAAVGGAVLARYLLPALALYFIWMAEQILKLPGAGWWIAACAAFLVVNWFWNPPYPFPYEDNLAYVQFVELHQAAARGLASLNLPGPVWTAWPATDELSKPELGYVTRPIAVHAVENFTAASLNAVPAAPPVLYLYSREYQPRWDLLARLPFWRRWGDRYFHHAPPLPASAWLTRWRLRPIFHLRRAGQWVTLAAP